MLLISTNNKSSQSVSWFNLSIIIKISKNKILPGSSIVLIKHCPTLIIKRYSRRLSVKTRKTTATWIKNNRRMKIIMSFQTIPSLSSTASKPPTPDKRLLTQKTIDKFNSINFYCFLQLFNFSINPTFMRFFINILSKSFITKFIS
jgi:hypothetical protein